MFCELEKEGATQTGTSKTKRQTQNRHINPIEVQIMKVNSKTSRRYYLAVNYQSDTDAQRIKDSLFGDQLPTQKNLTKKQENVVRKFRKKVKFANTSEMVKKGTKDKSRHAEEYLCDIADSLKAEEEGLRFTIYSKKDPCITCTARMKVSHINDYSPNYGRLFLASKRWTNNLIQCFSKL